MKKKKLLLSSLLATVILISGCATSPSFNIYFPFSFLQDIPVPVNPNNCCYLGSGNDGIVSAGDSLYFVNYSYGNCVARVYLDGYTIEDVGATDEGGYALALCGNLLYHISNDIYTVHDPTPLDSYGKFILTNPQGNRHLYSIGVGSITTINSNSWDVVATHSISGLVDPVEAVITANGTAIYIADASDNKIKKISTAELGAIVAECEIPGGISDLYAGSGNLIYASCDSISAVWGIDTGTGQHLYTYDLPAPAVCIAVTPNDHYIFAGFSNGSISVVNAGNLEIEATSTTYSTPLDMAINGNNERSIICSNAGMILTLQK